METGKETGQNLQRPVVEWIVGGLSALLVMGLAAHLAYGAMFGDVHPPDLRATIEAVEALDTSSQARISVMNHGDKAASSVVVRLILSREEERDIREIEFDYVAGHSVRHGAIVFPLQPSTPQMEIEVGGYVEP